MLEQLKKKRILGAVGLVLLFLGTILPYFQYSFFGYSVKISLYNYLEGKIVIVLIVANLLFIFRDFVEKYIPQMFHSTIGQKIKNADSKMAMVPTILIVVFVIILFLRVDLGNSLNHGLGFFALWLGVICLVAHSFIYKNQNEVLNYDTPISPNSNVPIIDQQQNMNNNSNIKYCPSCGSQCDGLVNNCPMCGKSFIN